MAGWLRVVAGNVVTDRQTDRQTDTQTKYCNRRCACAPRVIVIVLTTTKEPGWPTTIVHDERMINEGWYGVVHLWVGMAE